MQAYIKQAGSVLALAFVSQTSFATIMYDQNVTPDVIFGSGNDNGSFTVDRNDGIELGLRGKLRHNASGLPENTFNSNGDGTYSFDAGVAPTQSSPTAVWSFEWSINSNYTESVGDENPDKNLSSLNYTLGIDRDPSQGTDYLISDPINVLFADHAIGNNSTGNGGGTVAADGSAYAALIDGNSVAQNSWKPHWFIPNFDPTVDGTYNFFLQAVNDSLFARTEIQVIVGSGDAAAVPEPGSLGLLGLGLAGLGIVRRKKRA